MFGFVVLCEIVRKANETLWLLHLNFSLIIIWVIILLFSNVGLGWFITIAWSASTCWSWEIASSSSTRWINLFINLIVGLEVILTASTTPTSLTSTASSGLKITTTAGPKSASLFNLEIQVILIGYKAQLNKASADIFLMSVVIGKLGIFCILELYDAFSCYLTCWVLSNFNWVFDQTKPMEELVNIVTCNGVGKAKHFNCSFRQLSRIWTVVLAWTGQGCLKDFTIRILLEQGYQFGLP